MALAPTTPVLVRVNFDDARFNGVEFNTQARLSDAFTANANFTYIRAHSLLNGLPPNVEGGVPPATAFVSLRFQPGGSRHFFIEAIRPGGQTRRLSSLDPGPAHGRARRAATFKLFAAAPRARPDKYGGGGVVLPGGIRLYGETQRRFKTASAKRRTLNGETSDNEKQFHFYRCSATVIGLAVNALWHTRDSMIEHIADKSYSGD